MTKKHRSTNPFDSDSSSDEERPLSDTFYDCDDGASKPKSASSSRRTAPLDFNQQYAGETPALQFDDRVHNMDNAAGDSAFQSPLDDALVMEFGSSSQQQQQEQQQLYDHELDSSLESEEGAMLVSEESPLLSTTTAATPYTGNEETQRTKEGDWKGNLGATVPLQNTTMKRNHSRSSLSIDTRQPRRSSLPKSRVLKELTSTRQEHELTREYKKIRLEDVGTAKSWGILLLPYFSFALCVLLESNRSLKMTELGPLSSHLRCFSDQDSKDFSVPILPAPPDPCMYQFDLSDQLVSPLFIEEQTHQKKNVTKSTRKTRGTAFESGIITSVPAAATVLFADATFYGLSLKAMAAIQKGSVSVSGLLFQKKGGGSSNVSDDWSLVATSRTESLSVACYQELVNDSNERQWVCHSPQIMDILFSMPGSAILSGNQLRINILFSYTKKRGNSDDASSTTYLYGDDQLHKMLYGIKNTEEEVEQVVLEIVKASEYTIGHTNPVALTIDVWGRLIALTVTVVFAIFWFRSMGFRGSCSSTCCSKDRDGDAFEIRRAISLIDSPWVLFPERWYILVVFFALVLIQGPLVVIMYFNPQLNTSARMRTASDTLVGVGVNAVLFVYLCLFQGGQYHTARVSRKWMDHHRKLNEIRRVASYVGGDKEDCSNEETLIRYTTDYYEKHGDLGFSSLSNLRLYHDPFGDYWADFLLPKLLLFVLGAVSIWLTAYTRFHFTSDEDTAISPESLRQANAIYLAGYLVQFFVLTLWLALILRSSINTGNKLRLQPFLSTRPAQLAYRVLFAHVTLGFLSLAVLLFLGLGNLLNQWKGGEQSTVPKTDQDSATSLNFWLQRLTRVTQRFPYSGSAASIGFGRIFFATVSILIAAFIFLPPKHIENDELDEAPGNEEDRIHQRRDKRAVVSMLKYAHTWRCFPLAIERASAVETMMLARTLFQLNSSGQKDFNNLHDPGVVSIGTYVPVFCVELACWLLEASFQAYYSPHSVEWNDDTPGKMNLSSIGLRLEAAILDESTNTQAFVATNLADQVDGEEDSIIVIAFRGSVDAANVKTDLKYGMVPLPDQLIGIGKAPFRVSASNVTIEESDGWVWNAQPTEIHAVSCFAPLSPTECLPFRSFPRKRAPLAAVSRGAMAVLSATPVARNTLPCVHEGFNEVYSVLRKKVIESVLPLLQRQLSKAVKRREGLGGISSCLSLPKIYCTGHSLGGCLAQLLALDLASNCELIIEGGSSGVDLKPEEELFQLPTPTGGSSQSLSGTKSGQSSKVEAGGRVSLQPPICCYSFGQPRVGNRAFSRLYKQRVPHTFRVATEGDPITTMPHLVCCAGIYKHAGLEVVLDEGQTGNTLVGPTVVETLFRFQKVRTDFAAHSTNRYRDCLESALEPHELQEYYRGHIGAAGLEEGYGSTEKQSNQNVPDWMTQGRSAKR